MLQVKNEFIRPENPVCSEPALGARDPVLPGECECLTEGDAERLENRLALVVVVLPGEHDMRRNACTGAQAVEEMLEDVCRYSADRFITEGTRVDQIPPAPAVESYGCDRLVHGDNGMGESL